MTEPVHEVEKAGFGRTKHWWRLPDGTVHRTDGFAYQRYRRDELEVECWVQGGEFRRNDGGPTSVTRRGDARFPAAARAEYWLRGPFHEYPANDDNERHRADGPAVIHYAATGGVVAEEWFVEGRRHRDGAPAVVEYTLDGAVVAEQYWVDGVLASGPGVEYFADGVQRREVWATSDGLHRDDGPAFTEWHADGGLKSEEFHIDGRMSRVGGPAGREWFGGDVALDQLWLEQWRIDDRLHRTDGPAVTVWHSNGAVAEEQWWIEGRRRVDGGPAIVRRSESGDVVAEVMWSDLPGSLQVEDYWRFHPQVVDTAERAEANEELRRWHRWALALEPAPQFAGTMDSSWLLEAPFGELDSRFAYLPNGEVVAERVVSWRDQGPATSGSSASDVEAVAIDFVEFVRGVETYEPRRELIDRAVAVGVTVVAESPSCGEGEFSSLAGGGLLDGLFDSVSVPSLVFESIYGAFGNRFLPVYAILEPVHGVDVRPWVELEQAGLTVVLGPDGIRVGPAGLID